MIVVTGGAGFIGSVLVRELNKKGIEDLIIVDRLNESEKWKNLLKCKYLEYFHSDDFFEEFEEYFQGVDYIFHLGACSSTTETDMDYLMENNVKFSKDIFLAAAEFEIPIIYASSAATYGLGELGYQDDYKNISKLRPLNRYGYSKQLFDEWVLKQNEEAKQGEGKMPPQWFGLKFFNVFGPNEYHKNDMRSIVHKAYQQIKEKNEVTLFKSHKNGINDGEQKRDFVYVKDVVRAMIQLMDLRKLNSSGIYNMGTGVARSFKELTEATFSALNKTPNIKYIDMPESIRNQYQYFTEADMIRFKKLFPDFKFTKLEEAVKDYVVNHLEKDDQYF